MAALVDTNVLVYRFDDRYPEKQAIATQILRQGIKERPIWLPHQVIIEFVAATTRNIRGRSILELSDALREAEGFVKQFTILYPNEAVLRTAMRGCAIYQLSWFDAHLWAYAEHFGSKQLLSEDLQDGRTYGSVTVVNPFV